MEDQFQFENREFTIIYKKSRHYKLSFKNGRFFLSVPIKYNKEKIREIIRKHKRWIKNREREYKNFQLQKDKLKLYERDDSEFEAIVLYLLSEGSKRMGVKYSDIKFKYMRSRWGSCSLKGKITINRYLKFFPYRLIEYVVFHELAHLKYHNHGKEFKNFLSGCIEDWRERKEELKIWGKLLRERYMIQSTEL